MNKDKEQINVDNIFFKKKLHSWHSEHYDKNRLTQFIEKPIHFSCE